MGRCVPARGGGFAAGSPRGRHVFPLGGRGAPGRRCGRGEPRPQPGSRLLHLLPGAPGPVARPSPEAVLQPAGGLDARGSSLVGSAPHPPAGDEGAATAMAAWGHLRPLQRVTRWPRAHVPSNSRRCRERIPPGSLRPPLGEGEQLGGMGRAAAAPVGQEQLGLSFLAGFGQGRMRKSPTRLGDMVVCWQQEWFSAGFVGQAVLLGCPRKGELVGLQQGNMRAGTDGASPAAVLSPKLQLGSSAVLGLVLPLGVSRDGLKLGCLGVRSAPEDAGRRDFSITCRPG